MPPSDKILETMMSTIIDGQTSIISTQKQQADDIREIRASMNEIVKIEAQQANQKEALQRIGQHVDKVEETSQTEREKLHVRINEVETIVTDLRIVSARMVVKVSTIAAGASAIVASIFAFLLPKIIGG